MRSRKELADAIRILSMDAVDKAKSGHPGAPMGMADMAEACGAACCVIIPPIPIGPIVTGSSCQTAMPPCCSTACCISPAMT